MRNSNLIHGLLVLVICFSSSTKAQTFGFNGKKNSVSIFATGGIRVFPMIGGFVDIGSGESTVKTIKYNSSNQMKKQTTIARYDLRLSYIRLLNKKLGIGAEFGYEKFRIPMTNFNEGSDAYGYYYQTVSDQSSPVFDAFSYMLVLEFHPDKSVAPIGFSSSIGFGPKIYKFNFKENYRYDTSTSMNNPYPKNAKDIMAINFFYQMNYKKVLSKFMTFDIGMRIHTGIVLPILFDSSSPSSSEYGRSQLRDDLFNHNLASLVSMRMGFTFLL